MSDNVTNLPVARGAVGMARPAEPFDPARSAAIAAEHGAVRGPACQCFHCKQVAEIARLEGVLDERGRPVLDDPNRELLSEGELPDNADQHLPEVRPSDAARSAIEHLENLPPAMDQYMRNVQRGLEPAAPGVPHRELESSGE